MIVRNTMNQIKTENNINVMNLFSIPIIDIMVEEDTPELTSNTEFISGTLQINNWSVDGSSYNPEWDFYSAEEKNYRILERYPNTKNILLKYIKSSLKNLGYACQFDLSTSWCTKSIKGDIGHMHRHKNCWFSGIYYYGDYDENSGKLFIENPLPSLSSFSDRIVDVNKFNTPISVIAPEKSRMVIFPSYLMHSIDIHNSDLIRYSLAFNIIPSGYYGETDSACDTNWYCGGN